MSVFVDVIVRGCVLVFDGVAMCVVACVFVFAIVIVSSVCVWCVCVCLCLCMCS